MAGSSAVRYACMSAGSNGEGSEGGTGPSTGGNVPFVGVRGVSGAVDGGSSDVMCRGGRR